MVIIPGGLINTLTPNITQTNIENQNIISSLEEANKSITEVININNPINNTQLTEIVKKFEESKSNNIKELGNEIKEAQKIVSNKEKEDALKKIQNKLDKETQIRKELQKAFTGTSTNIKLSKVGKLIKNKETPKNIPSLQIISNNIKKRKLTTEYKPKQYSKVLDQYTNRINKNLVGST